MTQSTFRESCVVFNTTTFQSKISEVSSPFILRFEKINRAYILFHTFFLSLLTGEVIFFGLFFPRFYQSAMMAFWLAGVFLTVFTYLVLLFYLQGRKPERLRELRDEYIEKSQSCIPFDPGTLEYHCCITEAIVHFMHQLRIVPIKNRFLLHFETLSYFTQKFIIWTKWKDLLNLKEMLLFVSIQEHIRLIKKEPSDLEAHASLAGNYVSLATLYQDPKKLALNDRLGWEPPEYFSQDMQKKFEMALTRALEEYHIIEAYVPNDPWVYAQRASLYKELGRIEEEQKEYEKILDLDPKNSEILFRLGKLYFCKGEIAKGIKIYGELQGLDNKKASDLIEDYDAYQMKEYSFET